MKKAHIIVIFFLLGLQTGYAQIESITRDKNQNYVITYYSEGEIREGIWVPGNLIKPEVTASVKLDSLSRYKYEYRVTNSQNSNLDLYKFEVRASSVVKNITYQNYPWRARYIGWQSRVKWSFRTGSSYGIPPGQKEIFSFESGDLPTIGFGYASNLTGLSFPLEDQELPGFVEAVLDSLSKVSGFVSFQTLIPQKLPDNITNPALLDTLQSYLSFSCDTTWIENRGICRSLKAKLENADRQLQRGNTQTAANKLQAFLNEVQALREKQLSSEAYALFRFNGQHLLGRLNEN